MYKMKYTNQTDDVYGIKAAGSKKKTFVLWREVVMAYAAPAIMAGIGGLVTADRSLQIGALTTIGGASALMALMIGLLLRSRVGHIRWVIGAPHLVVVGVFALAGSSFGLCAAWMTSGLLEFMIPSNHLAWVGRVWIDFPLSGFLASTIVTWRWRLAATTNFSSKRRRKK
ncbi:hypothetical protein PC41400_17885 [Paenibacillus chitinolyticus]|uniref:Uncharacterized protein n=1 Tax=Paenibacillus chitinolyticus TaxID=79263 RepID=A0A410WZ17_9BACL|nr:hypothetical protein [Paenibacillus chitinolyticus]MCY9590591.1 hypothetical protein [Paenibacillus chitinolyticus]MCY9596414.1 hypothetical protein [Paenibacillus chitinolyticus]QAV19431.1 hypothetical protein PC41400_17885 [Paenibacillus chitinolyticus]